MRIWIYQSMIVLSLILNLSSQNLYMPLELRHAYRNKTRSLTGNPGINYWQNRADYDIRVKLLPEISQLKGREIIHYQNHSPDTLSFVVFQLYQDMNKPGMPRRNFLHEKSRTKGIKILKLQFEKDSLYEIHPNIDTQQQGTMLRINLPEPILPGTSADFRLVWQMDIPGRHNMRMGQYDSTSFFLGLFYPEMVVYDDVSGWDSYSYDGLHEFYTEYGDFNLKVTVPRGFMVWSTGEWQNADNILPDSLMQAYLESLESDSVFHLVNSSNLKVWSSLKSVHDSIGYEFIARNVPKVAFGCSDHYLWDASSLRLQSGKRVSVQTAYKPGAFGFKEVVSEVATSIRYLSSQMPGLDYPYPKMTVFHGEGGMEYPMIVNDGNYNLKWLSMYVTSHEIAHTWFPFVVGINEHRYAWMDEGWAYFLPLKIQEEESGISSVNRAVSFYEKFAGKMDDVPLMTPTRMLSSKETGALNYFKPALAYKYLEGILGSQTFSKILKEYIQTWDGKHPTAYDFFNFYNHRIGKNIDWYWKNWFFERHYPDLGIKNIKIKKNVAQITIQNKGGLFVPVIIQLHTRGGGIESIEKAANVWEKNPHQIKLKYKAKQAITQIILGNEGIPDVAPEDNVWKKK